MKRRLLTLALASASLLLLGVLVGVPGEPVTTPMVGSPIDDACRFDASEDGAVGIPDFNTLVGAFGATCERLVLMSWAPATGPVVGYTVWTKAAGESDPGTVVMNVDFPEAAVPMIHGADTLVRVAAYDASGADGPFSPWSLPVRTQVELRGYEILE